MGCSYRLRVVLKPTVLSVGMALPTSRARSGVAARSVRSTERDAIGGNRALSTSTSARPLLPSGPYDDDLDDQDAGHTRACSCTVNRVRDGCGNRVCER